jgi:plastocyanin
MKLLIYAAVAVALLAGLFQYFKPVSVPPPASSALPAQPPAIASTSSPVDPSTAATLPEAAPRDSGMGGATASDATTAVDLVIAKGKLASGPNVVKVKQGDPVVFHVTSDIADELHLHGYNLHLKLRPHETATLKVETTRMGRFTYELHHNDLELGALEVYPR